MPYFTVKVDFETGETNKRTGVPIIDKSLFLVSGEDIIDVENKISLYLKDSVSFYTITQISKTKIEAVVT